VTARRLLGAFAATVLLAGCGGSGGESGTAAAPPSDQVNTSAPSATTVVSQASGSPFDLSVLGPAWRAPSEPFRPAPARPSDCPEFDRLKAEFAAWATTQRSYRVDGHAVVEVNAKAPDAAAAASFLDRQSKVRCARANFAGGGSTVILPATSRANQTAYALRPDAMAEEYIIVTVKGPWLIQVTVLDFSTAQQVTGAVLSTLSDQARA
jgi:hypothetical protein